MKSNVASENPQLAKADHQRVSKAVALGEAEHDAQQSMLQLRDQLKFEQKINDMVLQQHLQEIEAENERQELLASVRLMEKAQAVEAKEKI